MFGKLVISGLAAGSLYALTAVAVVVVFRNTRTINLAQGDFAMIGAFMAMIFIKNFGLNDYVSLGLGLLLERLVMRPIAESDWLTLFTATLGVNYILHGVAGWFWGRDTKAYTERAKLGWKAPVINVFFGKSPKVPELAGDKAVEGVYFATIFREWDDPNPKIQQAKSILKKFYPEEQPDAVQLLGFTGAQVFSEALKRMGRNDITRARLLDALDGIDDWKGSVVPVVDIGEVGPGDEAVKHLLVPGMNYVVYTGGRFHPYTPPWLK